MKQDLGERILIKTDTMTLRLKARLKLAVEKMKPDGHFNFDRSHTDYVLIDDLFSSRLQLVRFSKHDYSVRYCMKDRLLDEKVLRKLLRRSIDVYVGCKRFSTFQICEFLKNADAYSGVSPFLYRKEAEHLMRLWSEIIIAEVL